MALDQLSRLNSMLARLSVSDDPDRDHVMRYLMREIDRLKESDARPQQRRPYYATEGQAIVGAIDRLTAAVEKLVLVTPELDPSK